MKTHGIIVHTSLSNELMIEVKEEFVTHHDNTGTVEGTSDPETDTRYKWHRDGRKKVVKIEDPEEIQELLTVRPGRKDAHCWISTSKGPKEDGTMSKERWDDVQRSKEWEDETGSIKYIFEPMATKTYTFHDIT